MSREILNIETINKAYELFNELEEWLRKYGDNSICYHYRLVKQAIFILEGDLPVEEKFSEVQHIVKSLYKGKEGGLSDFYVWRDDFDERLAINKLFSRINAELWKMFQ